MNYSPYIRCIRTNLLISIVKVPTEHIFSDCFLYLHDQIATYSVISYT